MRLKGDDGRVAALTALHGQMRACRLCQQAGHAVQPSAVFSGRLGAQVMTIGQAPGPTEPIAGRPFNAGSGKRLFEWLAQAGFDEAHFRATQYMTSVTKCYPGRGSSGDRVPSKDEQALCRPYLDREIELVNPRLIIPIGRLAIGLFFDLRQPLDAIIGRELDWQGRWVIPLPHPSGASTWHRKPTNAALIERALIRIAARRVELGIGVG